MKKLLLWEGVTTMTILFIFFVIFSLPLLSDGWSATSKADAVSTAAAATAALVICIAIAGLAGDAVVGTTTGNTTVITAGVVGVITDVSVLAIAIAVDSGIVVGIAVYSAAVAVFLAIAVYNAALTVAQKNNLKLRWVVISFIVEAAIIFFAMTIPTGFLGFPVLN